MFFNTSRESIGIDDASKQRVAEFRLRWEDAFGPKGNRGRKVHTVEGCLAAGGYGEADCGKVGEVTRQLPESSLSIHSRAFLATLANAKIAPELPEDAPEAEGGPEVGQLEPVLSLLRRGSTDGRDPPSC